MEILISKFPAMKMMEIAVFSLLVKIMPQTLIHVLLTNTRNTNSMRKLKWLIHAWHQKYYQI